MRGRRAHVAGTCLSRAVLACWRHEGPVGWLVSAGLPVMVLGNAIELRVAFRMLCIGERDTHAIGISGSVPGPLIRLREGHEVSITVVNDLADEATSIHWLYSGPKKYRP